MQERVDAFFANIITALTNLHFGSIIGEQVGKFTPHPVVDIIAILILQAGDGQIILDCCDAGFEGDDSVGHMRVQLFQ
jgi:hypothetical protein